MKRKKRHGITRLLTFPFLFSLLTAADERRDAAIKKRKVGK
jgi:hypothetical protein